MEDLERLRRLVAQAAEASSLMGVDYVPVYRAQRAPQGIAIPAKDRPQRGDAGLSHRESAPVRAPAYESATARAAGIAETSKTLEPGPAPRDPAAAQRALDEVRARYERDAPHKKFVTAHTKIVFGEGNPCARLMFIGEAPGADEDRLGRPFVGRSGQLLDKMIAAMGLKREDVYIANVLKTRPPDNATPTMEETRLCAPYLFDQIRCISPEAIVTLGLPAARALLETTESMGRLRGRWATFRAPDGRLYPVMPTYHPAFLLRSYTEENRLKVWEDLRKVMARLGLEGSGRRGGRGAG